MFCCKICMYFSMYHISSCIMYSYHLFIHLFIETVGSDTNSFLVGPAA